MVKDMRIRLVLATVFGLTLGVYSVYEVLQNSDINALDGLLPGGRGASRRVNRAAENETTAASNTTPGTEVTSTSSTASTTLTTTASAVSTSTSTDIASTQAAVMSSSTTQNTEGAETTKAAETVPTETPQIPVSNSNASENVTTLMPTTTTTTTTPPLPCDQRPFPISQVCNLSVIQQEGYLGAGVVLGELADTFFNEVILDGLATKCENGTWCLGYNLDKDLLLGDSQVYMQYCDLQECLTKIPAECMTHERELVISTLKLLCEARTLNVTDRCILGIKKMTHVALVDEVVTVNQTGPNCAVDKAGQCTQNCLGLGQQLACMWSACSDQMDIGSFTAYGQWRWVLQGVTGNNTDVCSENNTRCSAFSDSTVLELKVFQQMLYKIQQNGPAVLAGIITALVVTVAGFGIIFWACAKKVYVFYEYSRDRVEYTEVKDNSIATESDSDEEDQLHPA